MIVIIYNVKPGHSMRVSKEKAAGHRAAIVKAAARLFREKGFDLSLIHI